MLLILFVPFLLFLAVVLMGAQLGAILWPVILVAAVIAVVVKLTK